MSSRARFALLALCVCVGVMLLATSAHAQTNLKDASGAFTGLLQLVQNNANSWADKLRGYATRVFWILATIQLVWTFFPLVLRQADFAEIVGELIRFVLVIGFFLALLLYSVEWANAIVQSFREAGGTASGIGKDLKPGDIFGLSVELAKVIGETKTMNPVTAMMIALAGLVVLLCFAFIAAFMAVTLVESYIVINASVLFMGFGGSQWTREYAIAMMRYAVAVGAKLFVLTLIVGLIVVCAQQWQGVYNDSRGDASMWTMVGLSLVCAYLAKQIPDLVQSLITGTSAGGGGALGGMAMAAAAIATAGVGAAIGAAGSAAAGGAAAGAGGSAAGGSAAAGAGGSGGLANLINSSMSGGANTAARSATAGTDAAAGSLAPRVGGSVGGSTGASGTTSTGGQTGGASGSQTSGANGKTGGTSSGQTSGTLSGHAMAAGAVRTLGTLAAISVPGMEGAAGLSIGPQPAPAGNPDEGREPGAEFRQSPENIIAPAEAPAPSATPAASPPKDEGGRS